VKIRTIGLAFVATAFMAGQALAQAGTMQPIPNPPEKAKPMKHKAHHKAMAKTEAKADMKTGDKAAMPKTSDKAMPAKK
jgi:hypothetical protein